MSKRPIPQSHLFPYTTLFRSQLLVERGEADLHRLDEQFALEIVELALGGKAIPDVGAIVVGGVGMFAADDEDRKSTRLNSSHTVISYAVFCLKKKKYKQSDTM